MDLPTPLPTPIFLLETTKEWVTFEMPGDYCFRTNGALSFPCTPIPSTPTTVPNILFRDPSTPRGASIQFMGEEEATTANEIRIYDKSGELVMRVLQGKVVKFDRPATLEALRDITRGVKK